MKIPHPPRSSTAPAILRTFAGAVVISLAMQTALVVHGATLLSKAPNVAVDIGLPFNSLEFENPLAGTETVLGHVVLDWRDADYAPGPPPWFDDWSVSNTNFCDGSLSGEEIYLRAQGVSASATTTVPSRIVSIHLNGDNNDGIAQVLVDGAEVARLDMFFAGQAGQCCETALILVTGLSDATHTITVNDLGAGQGGGVDVHIMGVAALKESPLKWNQPPVAANPTNVFYGWNQPSEVTLPGMLIAADDWVCASTKPVTKIRWWGSYSGWTQNTPPPVTPNAFQILLYSDIPTNAAQPFSEPGGIVWQIYTTNYTSQFAGWDYDPRTATLEACFQYEATLAPSDCFAQPGGPGTIYWVSIAASYQLGAAPALPWGWKTLPRDPTSPAPDAAVFSPNNSPGWSPIPGLDPTNSWDLAFELLSEQTEETVKWEQLPDLSPNGMDVNDTFSPPAPPPYLLADDFLCTSPGYLTNITIWGSWTNDVDWQGGVTFTLSIHDDIPASATGTFSAPGQLLWQGVFQPGQYGYSVYANNINEWWFTPPNAAVFPGDHTCFQYDFNMPTNEAFWQEGTAGKPKVYWLDVQAQLQGQVPPYCALGWKTCATNWNDDAVWTNAMEPSSGPWNEVVYPPNHPLAGGLVDLAFRLNAGLQQTSEVKWSQPPVFARIPNLFLGWNETDHYGESRIVADDWACTTTNPVTDLHWWGSFLNWTEQTIPLMPDAFYISFWTDVPLGADPQNPFSHPGVCLQVLVCTNFTCQFAGWDWDPRNPNGFPEPCFRFDQELSTNEWFHQDPGSGTNIYWIGISAFYANPSAVNYPWGWKTRPRDTNSLAPDDAVRIVNPTAPLPGMSFVSGQPIWWPSLTNSWDMAFALSTRATEEQDFGDAPDPYPTLLTNNAARHYILPGFCLGNVVDAETNGLPTLAASGDDANNLADEDGVIFSPPLLVGTQACIQVILTSFSGSGQLDAWMDFNRDGSWIPGEKVFNNFTLYSGTNNLAFSIPTTAAVGPTYMRFRLSSAGGLLPTGAAADGEVEDYVVTNMQHRPLANIVITNIVLNPTNVTVHWSSETNVHYWLQAATNLCGNPSITWVNVGSEVIGPANSQSETNAQPVERYYRVIAPYVWP
jgi:hypothetical protein